MDVTTGLPQGSTISPALFSIYIAEIHAAVEGQVEDSRGISCADDVTWLADGTDLNDAVNSPSNVRRPASGGPTITQCGSRPLRPRRSSSPE